MATSKKEFSSVDAAAMVLYALRSPSDTIAYPVLVTSAGALTFASVDRSLKGNQKTTISTTTSTTVITSASATYLDVYGVIVVNTSATATVVRFKDNTTEKFDIAVPAGETRGFMLPSADAIAAAAAGTQWVAVLDTAVSSVEITMLYVKNS